MVYHAKQLQTMFKQCFQMFPILIFIDIIIINVTQVIQKLELIKNPQIEKYYQEMIY